MSPKKIDKGGISHFFDGLLNYKNTIKVYDLFLKCGIIIV